MIFQGQAERHVGSAKHEENTVSSKYYSPYIDMTLPSDLGKLARQSGLSDFTLAFMQGRNSQLDGTGADAHLKQGEVPTLSWGGLAPGELPTQKIARQIEQIQADGGTITISFGGYGGRDVAVIANQYSENLQDGPKDYSKAQADRIAVTTLTAEYQSVIDTYGVDLLDFDIEPDTITGDGADLYDVVGDKAANHLRDLAINKLRAANPDLEVSFTIATQPDGLPHDPSYIGGNVLGILKQAKADHVDLDVVNIMAMDYFSGAKHPDMGQLAIDAAKAVHKQLINLGMDDVKIAITPMIGQNDNWENPKTSEVFTLEDARQVTAFVAKTSWVAGIGMWELPRDMAAARDTTNREPTSHRSGVIQDQWEFSSIFDQITRHASAGTDVLAGGRGSDTLTGGAGDDQFVFNSRLGSNNVDRITDFAHRHDRIDLSQSIFGAVGDRLSKGEFLSVSVGHTAQDDNDHIIYNSTHGTLWYDADGKGGADAVEFAIFDAKPSALTAGDFHMLAL